MDATMKTLMQRCYIVPERTLNEEKMYELATILRQELHGSQLATLEAMLEACVDWAGDIAEDAFVQGASADVKEQSAAE